jgi:hypothetical protein
MFLTASIPQPRTIPEGFFLNEPHC